MIAGDASADIVIPGEVWTQFLEQEYQLDQETLGVDVSLSAVVAEIRRMIAEHELVAS